MKCVSERDFMGKCNVIGMKWIIFIIITVITQEVELASFIFR